MFLEQQISILEWFLKDHVTDWSNGCWKFSFAVTGINYIWKYIQTENIFKLQQYFTIILYIHCIFDKINVIPVSINKKHNPKLLNGSVYLKMCPKYVNETQPLCLLYILWHVDKSVDQLTESVCIKQWQKAIPTDLIRGIELPSLRIPTRKHFFKRQYWHWLRWCWSIWQSRFDLKGTKNNGLIRDWN